MDLEAAFDDHRGLFRASDGCMSNFYCVQELSVLLVRSDEGDRSALCSVHGGKLRVPEPFIGSKASVDHKHVVSMATTGSRRELEWLGLSAGSRRGGLSLPGRLCGDETPHCEHRRLWRSYLLTFTRWSCTCTPKFLHNLVVAEMEPRWSL
jgi:hypothetical protein